MNVVFCQLYQDSMWCYSPLQQLLWPSGFRPCLCIDPNNAAWIALKTPDIASSTTVCHDIQIGQVFFPLLFHFFSIIIYIKIVALFLWWTWHPNITGAFFCFFFFFFWSSIKRLLLFLWTLLIFKVLMKLQMKNFKTKV